MKPYGKGLEKGYCCDICDGPLSKRRRYQKKKKVGKKPVRQGVKKDIRNGLRSED